jgi:radical SAM superfamily enzyme YgiQ (UPF0313 family)
MANPRPVRCRDQTPGSHPPTGEHGAVRKQWRGRRRVALAYPNAYRVGMANLGFQTVYRLLNELPGLLCERVFYDPKLGATPVAVESGRPLDHFEIVAFSVSFENDYLNLLDLLQKAGLPLRAAQREAPHPLVIAGGVACFLNPEPLAEFIDCFLLGEAEQMLPAFMARYDPHTRRRHLHDLAQRVPGLYVPAAYRPHYSADGRLAAFEAATDVPRRVTLVKAIDIAHQPTCTSVVSGKTTFDSDYLVEVGRGCPHGCRFCSAGYIYRPVRFRHGDILEQCLHDGARLTRRIGLVGAAVTDLPALERLCTLADKEGLSLAFSSLRADALTSQLAATIAKSGTKTATIAPDAGSERMRQVINKGLTESQILAAVRLLITAGVLNLRLYYMVGLPTETMADVEAIVRLTLAIREVFVACSRPQGRLGRITVSLNCFVPKPATPFQWAPMATAAQLKGRIAQVKKALAPVPNVELSAGSHREAAFQAVLARGDRRLAEHLEHTVASGGNWRHFLQHAGDKINFYRTRPRELDELLPWDFIDTGIDKRLLVREYQRALDG